MRRQVRSLANKNQVSIQVLFVYYKFYVICDVQVHGNTVWEIEQGADRPLQQNHTSLNLSR